MDITSWLWLAVKVVCAIWLSGLFVALAQEFGIVAAWRGRVQKFRARGG